MIEDFLFVITVGVVVAAILFAAIVGWGTGGQQ